jgi:hypothetical protein
VIVGRFAVVVVIRFALSLLPADNHDNNDNNENHDNHDNNNNTHDTQISGEKNKLSGIV